VRVVLDGRCIQDHFPGIARYTFNLALALAKTSSGDEVVVLVDSGAANSRYDLDRLRGTRGIRVVTRPAPVFSLIGQARASLAIVALRPEIYHSPFYLRPLTFGAPTVVTIFDVIPEKSANPPGSQLRSHLARFGYHLAVGCGALGAARVIVPSAATADDLRLLHGVAPHRTATIPLGVDPIFRRAEPAAIEAVRRRFGLPNRFILSVGINKPHKNLDTLIRCLRHLPVNSVRELVLVGPTDRRFPGPADLAHRHGVGERVRSLGQIDDSDLAALYSAATVFAFPSLAEGFGLPPLEAMACGTPVVCSNAGSLPEVVGDAALLVDPRDERALAAALVRVLADEAYRREMSERGVCRAAELTWPAAARATWQVYREAADRC
jgi:alpha-1,3-rhamnosyl/mannosyltransferase